MKIFDKNYQPLSNFEVVLDFNILKYPSYLYNEAINAYPWSDFKKNHFVFSQISNATNKNGEISIKIQIVPNYVGIYVINFMAEAAVSDPIEFQTENLVSKISINKQPFFDFSLNDTQNKTQVRSKYLRSGNFLPSVKIPNFSIVF